MLTKTHMKSYRHYIIWFFIIITPLLVLNCKGSSSPQQNTEDPSPDPTKSPSSDADEDGYSATSAGGGDCDDSNAAISPAATEVCDEIDNNCDGSVDEGKTITYYMDVDGDGYGDSASSLASCTAPAQMVTISGDCNDNSPSQYPGNSETCDGLDNNCDGSVDEGVLGTFYADADGDGYGNAASPSTACAASAQMVANSADCDDNDASRYPGNTETCDEADDDCDGNVDEGVLNTYYQDTDGDGYGNPAVSTNACAQPAQMVANAEDCNDSSASQFPGNSEDCDGVDNDCDSVVPSDELDNDNDALMACAGDCNDSDNTVYPGATDSCDAKDNDCDGLFDAVEDGQDNWQRSVCGMVVQRGDPATESGVDQASVIYNPDLDMYQMWFRIVMASGTHAIGYAESNDGVIWTKYGSNPVFSPNTADPTSWDGSKLGFPSVIYKNGIYHMWYQGHSGASASPANAIRIGYATSDNGINWTRISTSAPVLTVGEAGTWEDIHVQAPSVIYDETAGRYKMWYTGIDDTSGNVALPKTGYAESTDGVTWTKSLSNPVLSLGDSGEWDDKRAVFARVHVYDGVYHMWYSGDNTTTNYNYQIGHAVSDDGLAWTKDVNNPLLEYTLSPITNFDAFAVYAGEVISLNEGYAMFYSGNPCSSSACTGSTTPYAIGMAVSPTVVP